MATYNEEHPWLLEKLKSIINFATTAIVLLEVDRPALLPTTLEAMFELCQEIVDAHCVVKDEKGQPVPLVEPFSSAPDD